MFSEFITYCKDSSNSTKKVLNQGVESFFCLFEFRFRMSLTEIRQKNVSKLVRISAKDFSHVIKLRVQFIVGFVQFINLLHSSPHYKKLFNWYEVLKLQLSAGKCKKTEV